MIGSVVYENAPQAINEARAKVLIGSSAPSGSYTSADRVITQYRTASGLVTIDRDTWGEDASFFLLRFKAEA